MEGQVDGGTDGGTEVHQQRSVPDLCHGWSPLPVIFQTSAGQRHHLHPPSRLSGALCRHSSSTAVERDQVSDIRSNINAFLPANSR